MTTARTPAGPDCSVPPAALEPRRGLAAAWASLIAAWTASSAEDFPLAGTAGSLGPMSTRLAGPEVSCGMPCRLFIVEPRPSSALPISLGTIHTLLASPCAICGIIWRYW